MYRLSKNQYNMLLIKKKIKISGRNILRDKEVLQCMDIISESNCFISLKYQK